MLLASHNGPDGERESKTESAMNIEEEGRKNLD